MTNGEDAAEWFLQKAASAAWNDCLVGGCERFGKAVISSMRGRDCDDEVPSMTSGVYDCRDRKAVTFAIGDSLTARQVEQRKFAYLFPHLDSIPPRLRPIRPDRRPFAWQ